MSQSWREQLPARIKFQCHGLRGGADFDDLNEATTAKTQLSRDFSVRLSLERDLCFCLSKRDFTVKQKVLKESFP